MALFGRIDSRASQDRLEKLIEERLRPGADKQAIDRRIWSLFGERWAVMFTDLAGFSRRVAEFGIIHFLQTIHESHRLLVPCIEQHCGILVKTEGDSLLVVFRTVGDALHAAVHMQQEVKAYNVDRSTQEQILLCVGIGYGDVLRIGDADVFGAEVNAAAKLGEDVARPWEILVTGAVREASGDTDFGFAPIESVPRGVAAAHRVQYEL